MSIKFFGILTHQGASRLANAAALGTKLDLSTMAVGDGGGSLTFPEPTQTALKGERRRAALNQLSIDPLNGNQIIAEQVIPENEGGWWIREIGLFDKDGTLIALANCPESYKPQMQEGSGRTQTIRMILIVNSTEELVLKIDPSIVLATRKYVDDGVIEVKALAAQMLAKDQNGADIPDPTRFIKDLGLQAQFSGRVLRIKKITQSQAYQWPDDVAAIDVTICGAGGGGGAGASSPSGHGSAGSGGGGGGRARSYYQRVSIPAAIAIEIGIGGQGGSADEQQPTGGGPSLFGDLMTARGGANGLNGPVFRKGSAPLLVGNGGGGDASGGKLFSSRGGSGAPALFLGVNYESGAGGDSVFSFGSPPIIDDHTVECFAGVYGAGGGGGFVIENSAGANGGNGGGGVCLIVEYSE
ncbi:phage tail protein [Candidatus Sodalis endolongispinus]|uniref:Phage tail protein n=1 Tax=Candidatus Sodalis endolongispinus TaxID=2812662 RepID=A0ABS5Y7U1_9GAMM|nr:phage tail protein [Candidatus Sodalis endolongispinus]MBT9431067.1 phage tail protein [Candidatus Sodalis endolongispinus]